MDAAQQRLWVNDLFLNRLWVMDRTPDDNSVTTDSDISVTLAPQATQAAEGSGAGGGSGGGRRGRRGSGSNGDGGDTRLRKRAKLRKRANTLLPATVVRAEFDASSSDIWMGMVAGEATQPGNNTPRGHQTASDIWTGALLGERGVSGRSDAGGGDGGGGGGGGAGGGGGLGDDLVAGVLRSGGAVVASRAAGYLTPTIELVQTSAPFYNVSAALRYNNFVVLGSAWDVGLLICDVEVISGAGRET